MASISDAARAWPSSQEDRPGPGRSWLEVPCPAAVRPARGSVQLPDRSHTPPPKRPGRAEPEGRGRARRSPERGAEGWDRREGACRGHCARGHRRQSLLGMAVGRGGRAKGLGPRDAGFVRRRPASGRGAEETLVGGRCTGAGARQERGEGAWGGGCAPSQGRDRVSLKDTLTSQPPVPGMDGGARPDSDVTSVGRTSAWRGGAPAARPRSGATCGLRHAGGGG